MTQRRNMLAMCASGASNKGVVLLTCLIILSLLAIMAIGGTSRALANLRLVNNMKLQEHSFMLAETALEVALKKTTENPLLLLPVTSLITAESSSNESYSVYSLYFGTGGRCDQNPNSTSHHYELIAIARVGQHANANHAIGISVCEYNILNVAGKSDAIVVFSGPTRTYWRQVDSHTADELLR